MRAIVFFLVFYVFLWYLLNTKENHTKHTIAPLKVSDVLFPGIFCSFMVFYGTL